MGSIAGQPIHAGHRSEPDRRDDRRGTAAWAAQYAIWLAAGLVWLLTPFEASADVYRIATFDTELSRKGPGLLARDLLRDDSADIKAVVGQIISAKPDVLILQGIDYDQQGVALRLIKDRIKLLGLDLPYQFARRPNTGMRTSFDLDRNGRFGEARDHQGYGLFAGQAGIAILSRYPIVIDEVRDFSGFHWHELPDTPLPGTGSDPYFTPEELAILRLHTVGAWEVPVQLPDGLLRVLTSAAGPPVFDGPEDRNGLRNSAEIGFWVRYLRGEPIRGEVISTGPFIFAGVLNNDPADGEGLKQNLHALLSHPSLQDPRPRSDEAALTPDPRHRGPAGLDTVCWQREPGPGNLRVDYVLPSASLHVSAAGVIWPEGQDGCGLGSRHRPVWVDVAFEN